MRLALILLSLSLVMTACVKRPDGTIEDSGRGRSIDFAIWLPVATGPAPLVVLSHGSGGHYANFQWLTDVLVRHGYVVAAVNHPHNTTRDDTPEGVARAWDRPPDLSLLLDTLLAHSQWSRRIDASRIAAAGFSSGGYTVLGLAGAIYDIDRTHDYCGGPDRGRECDLAAALPLADPDSGKSYKDHRVRAVFAMAPGWGGSTTPESLAAIDIPVKIVATADDEILNPDRHAKYFDSLIPASELVMLPEGGHFLFLSCDPLTRVADWFIDQFDLCGAQYDVDRETEQRAIATQARQFFDQHIAASN